MKLINTRPEEDATALSDRLTVLGHESLTISLLAINPRPDVVVPERSYQLICITSANALRSTADLAALKPLPLFTVGPQSLAEAKKHGFNHASAHGGDVNGMVHHIRKVIRPEAGPILYLSGSETSSDLAGQLKHAGYTVERVITYDAVPAEISLTAAELAEADGVLLYSPRSAKFWAVGVAQAGLEAVAAKLTHYCLSANVAARLPQNWPRRIASHPNETALFDLLDQSATNE